MRTDGHSNSDHLLVSFPVLFPYGTGGFEVGRDQDVPYRVHARLALQYHDRYNLQFIFQVPGVIQKQMVCRSATRKIKRSALRANEAAIRILKPSDVVAASTEKARS